MSGKFSSMLLLSNVFPSLQNYHYEAPQPCISSCFFGGHLSTGTDADQLLLRLRLLRLPRGCWCNVGKCFWGWLQLLQLQLWKQRQHCQLLRIVRGNRRLLLRFLLARELSGGWVLGFQWRGSELPHWCVFLILLRMLLLMVDPALMKY